MNDGAKPALPLFVFDFDGVVCDSTDECMVTSWNAWEQWQAGKGFRTAVADFSAAECERFRTLRPRVRGAGEYYIIRRSFAEGITIPDQRTYDGLMTQWKAHIAPFAKLFFEMRDRLRNDNLPLWIDLHSVYAEVVSVMAELDRQGRLYIATLKDGKSVKLILARHGIEIAAERLLDESKAKSKLQALDSIRQHTACNRTDLVFIDDNVTHIVEPHASGYPVWLAAWGASLPEYRQVASAHGIPVLEAQDSVRQLVCERGIF